mmetsp:Transcript_72866/g.236737  ORF Transcript_72866/g.236737 Transcript_72866/m.236737 type:complete len:642 (+) Transcript_72866:184-2109(+)
MRLDLDGGLGGGSGSGLPRPAQFRGQELVAELSSDPYLQSLVAAGPGGVEDGALAPKPMWPMEDWEPMGAREHRALYAALTKLGALRRSRSSSSSAASEVGATRDEEVGGSSSSAAGASPPEPETFLALSVFLEDFAQSCGPVARRVSRYQAESPEQWRLLLGQLEAVAAPEAEAATASEVAVGAGPGERRGRTRRSGRARRRISLQLFLDMMELWARSIGVPRDIRAACADFVPGTCNILSVGDGAIGLAYDQALASSSDAAASPMPGASVAPLPARPCEVSRGAHALLFACEGSQRLGMLKGLAERLPRFRDKAEAVSKRMGFDILDVCINGPKERLDSLEVGGVAMYLAGWGAYEKLLEEEPTTALGASAVAGMDVGEYVALTVAGVLPFEAGLELAIARGRALQQLFTASSHLAVCSVAGLPEAKVRTLCAAASSIAAEAVAAAAASSADGGGGDELDAAMCQIVSSMFNLGYTVGGSSRAIDEFKRLAEKEGALQVKTLPGQPLVHSSAMNPLQWVIKAKLRDFEHSCRSPCCDVYFNASAAVVLRAAVSVPPTDLPGEAAAAPEAAQRASREVFETVTRLLCEACWRPLRWDAQVKAMLGNGVVGFHECGPGSLLRMLMKRIHKEAFESTKSCLV